MVDCNGDQMFEEENRRLQEDYAKPWTDERFYNYFNINKEEQELIEKYAEKIWNRLNEK